MNGDDWELVTNETPKVKRNEYMRNYMKGYHARHRISFQFTNSNGETAPVKDSADILRVVHLLIDFIKQTNPGNEKLNFSPL
jgi:hypothetical protein